MSDNADFQESAFLKIKDCLNKRIFSFFPKDTNFSPLNLITWQAINEMLVQNRLEFPRLRIFNDGNVIPPSNYTKNKNSNYKRLGKNIYYSIINEAKLYEELKKGGTLVIDSIDELHEPLSNYTQHLEQMFNERIKVNCYMSWKSVKGIATHWDDHDVVILQIYGQKDWSIFEDTKMNPAYINVNQEKPNISPTWERTLNQGEMLFIPRGVWHHAIARDMPSLHLTFSFSSKTGLTYLQWLQKKFDNLPLLKHEVPRFPNEKHLEEYNSEIKSSLIKVISESHIKEYIDDFYKDIDKRIKICLPWAITDNAVPDARNLHVCFNSTINKVSLSVENQSIALSSHNADYTLPMNLKPLLDILQDHQWHSFDDIGKNINLDPKELLDTIMALVSKGLLAIKEE